MSDRSPLHHQQNIDRNQVLENIVDENLILIIKNDRNKILQISQILEEMEQVNQENIIQEDQETIQKDEKMKNLIKMYSNKVVT